jgi:flagellar biosynthetic protein FliP
VITATVVGSAPALPARAQSQPGSAASQPADIARLVELAPDLQTPQGASTALKWLAAVTVLSLAPAILVMVTSFTRIAVVLGLLRQALATAQLPPNQVIFALSLLMTLVVMAPVYRDVNSTAIGPYFSGNISQGEALKLAETRVRAFMIDQIEGGDNSEDVYVFLPKDQAAREDLTWSDVPTLSLLPAFVVSELKIAFLMGFRIFLPFLVIDMLTASILVSMGMFMLPPMLISLPFKLLLFVLADGWHLVVGTLMASFG